MRASTPSVAARPLFPTLPPRRKLYRCGTGIVVERTGEWIEREAIAGIRG